MVSRDIMQNLNDSISPCDDFYTFACGGWMRANPIPIGYNKWSTARNVSHKVAQFVKQIIDFTRPNDPPSRGLNLSRSFFKSCMDVAAIDARGFIPLFRSFVKLFGGWSLLPAESKAAHPANDSKLTTDNFSLTGLYLPLFRLFGSSPIFDIDVERRLENTTQFIIQISEGSVGLEKERYKDECDNTHYEVSAQRRHHFNLFRKTKRADDRNNLDLELDCVTVKLGELQKFCPVIDWKWLLNELFKPLQYTVDENQLIAIDNKEDLRLRCGLHDLYLHDNDGIRTLHNVAIWQFLWRTTRLMPDNVNQAMKEFKMALYGTPEEKPRWELCVSQVSSYFTMVIGRLYAREHLERNQTDAVKNIDVEFGSPPDIWNITKENKTYLHMSQIDDKKYFENNLICMEALVLNNLQQLIEEDKHRWTMSPIEVNAVYVGSKNQVNIPAGILQYPFYCVHCPTVYNYGGLGEVFGHELAHALDYEGSKRDPEGNLRNWWTNQTREVYKNRSQCFVEQYNNITVLNSKIDGKLTLGENIADNVGLQVAFKVSLNLLHFCNSTDN
ncbi:hypothetical protein FBUS_06297 [Fasciolopsis buskii]|uniref:Endothelin-converting enzyme 1 n=1 Tax=Fasciolopsis buskii TaxID=27845 RepID=A0A8E0VHS9_9TREM|nr:hypothetical protein FBUS_06297 [Fasciolopsis buski]